MSYLKVGQGVSEEGVLLVAVPAAVAVDHGSPLRHLLHPQEPLADRRVRVHASFAHLRDNIVISSPP